MRAFAHKLILVMKRKRDLVYCREGKGSSKLRTCSYLANSQKAPLAVKMVQVAILGSRLQPQFFSV